MTIPPNPVPSGTLDKGDNLLPPDLSDADYAIAESRSLQSAFEFLPGRAWEIADRLTYACETEVKGISMRTTEIYIEVPALDARAAILAIAPRLQAYACRSHVRTHGSTNPEAQDVNRNGGELSVTARLGKGISIKAYAKTRTLVRFEVRFDQPGTNILPGGYCADDLPAFFQKLSVLKTKAASVLRGVFGYLRAFEAQTPQEIAQTAAFEREWRKVFRNVEADEHAVLTAFRQLGGVNNASLVGDGEKAVLKKARRKGLVSLHGTMFFPIVPSASVERYLLPRKPLGRFSYRRAVPVALRAIMGKREIIRPLKTLDRQEAKHLAYPVHLEVEALFENAERRLATAMLLIATTTVPESLNLLGDVHEATQRLFAVLAPIREQLARASQELQAVRPDLSQLGLHSAA